jgi:hypothetical protein
MQYLQTLPWADTISVHNLLVAEMCTRLKKIKTLQKDKPIWGLGNYNVGNRNCKILWNNNPVISNGKLGMWKRSERISRNVF